MGVNQVDLKVVDRVLELLNEAFSWIKTQVEAFFKLLRNGSTKAFWSAKSVVINCCEKLKQVLAEINNLIDVGVEKLSEPIADQKNKTKNPEEGSLLDELKRLFPKVVELVDSLTKSLDPEWRSKGENLKGPIDLVEGFIDLLQISLNSPVKLIIILVDGFVIYRQTLNNPVGNAWKFPKHKGKGKAALAIAALLGLISVLK